MDYKPAPIDISTVALTQEIVEQTELLARNACDIWARQRFDIEWFL